MGVDYFIPQVFGALRDSRLDSTIDRPFHQDAYRPTLAIKTLPSRSMRRSWFEAMLVNDAINGNLGLNSSALAQTSCPFFPVP